MSTPIYSKTDHRKNITLYWQQYFPKYKIPKFYHVHHIKPKCTFEDKNDPMIHHPRNLIALHPDDHQSIHRCRGDIRLANGILSVKQMIRTKEHTNKIADANRGQKRSKPAWNKGLPTEQQPRTGQNHKAESKLKTSKSLTGRKRPHEVIKKVAKSMIGKSLGKMNGNFLGYYITPWGTFESLKATYTSCPFTISERLVQKLCRFKNKEIVSIDMVRQCEYFNLGAVGRTPDEMGFNFIYG